MSVLCNKQLQGPISNAQRVGDNSVCDRANHWVGISRDFAVAIREFVRLFQASANCSCTAAAQSVLSVWHHDWRRMVDQVYFAQTWSGMVEDTASNDVNCRANVYLLWESRRNYCES